MNKKFFILLVLVALGTSAAFAQGRGGGVGGVRGGGAPAGGLGGGSSVGEPSTPSGPASQPNNRPSNPGKPTSPSTASDHRADVASSHAVDSSDTHGFKNYGQYVAANEVSQHLGIPLADLKASMDAQGGNLGKAIHTFHPELSSNEVKAEVKRAESAAKKAESDAKRAEAEAKKKATS